MNRGGGWQQVAQGIECTGGLAAGRGGGSHGDGKAGGRIDEGEQVAAEASLEAHHGIAGEHFKRLGLAAVGWGCAIESRLWAHKRTFTGL